MCTRFKFSFGIIFSLFFASAVIAAVEPKNVIVFFLPVQNYDEITSVQEAVPTILPKGVPEGMNIRSVSEKEPYQEKHGISTVVGVSLYEKGGIPLDQAADQIVEPARVLILPPETDRKKKKSFFKWKTPPSVMPDRLRIFPMTNPARDIKKAAKERSVVIKYQRLKPPADNRLKRPQEQAEWTGWILGELKNCNMDAQTVLPTLYWLSSNRQLTDGKNSCDMKQAVAKHLQKCHPWPIVYYTPVNNDVPVRPPVQMAAEYLETDFETKECPALDLGGINFERTDFVQGNLKNSDFSNSYFHEATFDQMDLSNAVFNRALLDNVLFRDVSLSYALFEKARLKYTHFHRVNAVRANFDAADLQNTQFRDVTLSGASFPDAVLQNTGWKDVRAYRLSAPRADFTKAGFDNVLFDQIQAPKANFENISCKDSVLKSSLLEHGYFYKAFFERTSFDRAQLSYADFRSAVFGKDVSFQSASLYKADFGDTDLTALSGFSIEQLMQTKVDKETQISRELQEYGAYGPDSYDAELDQNRIEPAAKADRYLCSKRICEDRLLGRASNQNLAVRAMTMLSDPNEKQDNQIWALCTIGCIAKKDKKLETSQVDILAAFVKRNRHWDPQADLFRPYTPLPPTVQMALYILTDPQIKRDLGHDVDLSGTDLRTADLSNGDLRNVSLAGSHLGGANLRGAETDLAFMRFDQAVIDGFTRLPKEMGPFKPFELPDSVTPPWWKPSTVRVFRDGSHLWTVTTENIPFSDELVARPEK
ncbi:MAG: pentapeptide repeat-containing protein [Alphaproteobacteria bacterium]|nr:pentapeptide repeat-containing protein [Alphaproteobacteria bacterium]